MSIREVPAIGGDELRTPAEVSRRLRIRPETLCRWRKSGRGPNAVKLGGRVYYPAADLEAWIRSQSVLNAAVPAAA